MAKSKNPEYEIGYKRPPKGTQFKPGHSGNRKGRPIGSRNFMMEIERELNAVVSITENGARKKVRKKQIIAKQMVNKAAAGDLKATALILNETRPMDQFAAVAGHTASLSFPCEDKRVMSSILKRLGQYALTVTEIMPAVPADSESPTSQQAEEGAPS